MIVENFATIYEEDIMKCNKCQPVDDATIRAFSSVCDGSKPQAWPFKVKPVMRECMTRDFETLRYNIPTMLVGDASGITALRFRKDGTIGRYFIDLPSPSQILVELILNGFPVRISNVLFEEIGFIGLPSCDGKPAKKRTMMQEVMPKVFAEIKKSATGAGDLLPQRKGASCNASRLG